MNLHLMPYASQGNTKSSLGANVSTASLQENDGFTNTLHEFASEVLDALHLIPLRPNHGEPELENLAG
jgi:hypothetical protein